MKNVLLLLLASTALTVESQAVETRFWQTTDQADFEKGTLTNLSLRSDGRLYLAPEFREIFDPSTPYLWALASDGKGHLYAGGGGSGSGTCKLFEIDPSGKGKTLAELEGLEIHAIAVGRDGQIYAATDPDGKVYKVSPQGKAQLFFDPHAKYIWALAFNRAGDLFVATGDQGQIFRVGRDGQGSVFFKTGETHARSLTLDAQDNLIVGTEPGGLILRVSANGSGFVLYQTPKREITAVAVAKTGEIYAAGVGTRSAVSLPVISTSVPPPSTTAATAAPVRASSPPPSVPPTPAPISGGSEVYRIESDGSPHRVFSNSQDIVYALGFDSSNRLLLATGNRGKIYRLDSSHLHTELIDASPTQITNLLSTLDGHMYAATGNIGRVYEIGNGSSKSGSFESETLDAGSFAYWGRFALRGSTKNARVMTRSGNLSRPQENWSAWAPLNADDRIASPSARFLQYKVDLSAAAEVASVEIAYLPKNIAPLVEDLEITPPNYKFPSPPATTSTPTSLPQSLTLPPMGQRKRPSSSSADSSTSPSLTYAKGMLGARWTALDENGDALIYAVEIRGVGETSWKLLKDKVREKYVSWDSTAFPDGEYVLRVTASDSPGNIPAEALSASLISDPFLMDNTPPRISNLGNTTHTGRIEIHWRAVDARSNIDRAEYSINGGDWILVEPKTKLSDALETEYTLMLDRQGQGEQTIAVRLTDAYENQAVEKLVVK